MNLATFWLSLTVLYAQGAVQGLDESDGPWMAWVYLAITVAAYALSWVPLILFMRDVKRSGSSVLAASKTFVLSFGLFLLPGIALALGLGLLVALVAGDANLAVLDPANAIMTLAVVSLAYRRTRRKMQFAHS